MIMEIVYLFGGGRLHISPNFPGQSGRIKEFALTMYSSPSKLYF